jgi:hypothetical protein
MGVLLTMKVACVWVAATVAIANDCPPLGSAPGMWDPQQPVGARWRLLDPQHECQQLQPLFTQYVTPAPTPAPRQTRIHILWLGDSLDQHAISCWCQAAGALAGLEALSGPIHAMHPSCTVCSLHNGDFHSARGIPVVRSHAWAACTGAPGLRMAMAYVRGVHPTGPYHLAPPVSAHEVTSAAAAWFDAAFDSHGPDAVVLSANLWGLARLATAEMKDSAMLRVWQHLPPALVQVWMVGGPWGVPVASIVCVAGGMHMGYEVEAVYTCQAAS